MYFFTFIQNRASDEPKLKGDKELKPVSMRVKDAAESLLSVIMDHVVRHYSSTCVADLPNLQMCFTAQTYTIRAICIAAVTSILNLFKGCHQKFQ